METQWKLLLLPKKAECLGARRALDDAGYIQRTYWACGMHYDSFIHLG